MRVELELGACGAMPHDPTWRTQARPNVIEGKP
jgi:hypothetical protein